MSDKFSMGTNELNYLKKQFEDFSAGLPALVEPVNNSLQSVSQTASIAFSEAANNSTNFILQLSMLQAGFDGSGILTPLTTINETLKTTKDILSDMWDTQQMTSFGEILDEVGTSVGIVSDAVSILADGQDVLTASKKLLNNELVKGIANWILEKGEIAATTVATWAHDTALKVVTATKKLFNAETWISIGNWIKETAGTVADTVAKGAQKAITAAMTVAQTALNFVMNMNPIALIVIAIAALVAGFVLLWTKCEGFRTFMTEFFKFIANGFIGLVNLLIKGINLLMKVILLPLNLIIDGLNLIPGVNIPNLKVEIPTIPLLATGGYPSTGQMFIAREAGPELVGTIGSRSAVVNNEQIVESVSRGVYDAVRAAIGGGASQGGTTEVKLYLDGKQITAAVEKVQRERGLSLTNRSLVMA